MAVAAGVDIAIGDYIIEIPDISKNKIADYIIELYKKTQEGNDFVFCTPQKVPFTSKIFYKLINKALINGMGQCCSSIATISSRRGQNKVEAMGKKIVNRTVAYCMSGLKYSTISVEGKYKNHRGIGGNIKLFVESLIYYTNYISMWMTVLAAMLVLVSCAFGIYSIIAKFMIETAYGWASNVLFVCLGFAGTFFLLAIIAVYLEHILKASLNSKNYIFQDVIKK